MENLAQLRNTYLELTNQILPALAAVQKMPVQNNHCFQRIILDNLFGCCWYSVLKRGRVPAYKQLTESQLEQAIFLCCRIVKNPPSYLEQLNQNSLEWRRGI